MNVSWQQIITQVFHVWMTQDVHVKWCDHIKRYYVVYSNETYQVNFLFMFQDWNQTDQVNFIFMTSMLSQSKGYNLRHQLIPIFFSWYPGNGFVKLSAACSLVEICSIWIVLFTTCDLNWCNLTDKCLVRACVFINWLQYQWNLYFLQIPYISLLVQC